MLHKNVSYFQWTKNPFTFRKLISIASNGGNECVPSNYAFTFRKNTINEFVFIDLLKNAIEIFFSYNQIGITPEKVIFFF